jgi:hypothetical protein
VTGCSIESGIGTGCSIESEIVTGCSIESEIVTGCSIESEIVTGCSIESEIVTGCSIESGIMTVVVALKSPLGCWSMQWWELPLLPGCYYCWVWACWPQRSSARKVREMN